MSASFRRNRTKIGYQENRELLDSGSRTIATVLERKGTKPWIGGITLTSTGLRDLDSIVGGGQPLGTVILLEEDRWTQDLALALARYWSAEALSQDQSLMIVTTQPNINERNISSLDDECTISHQGLSLSGVESFLNLLPRDLHLDKQRAKMSSKVNDGINPSNQLKTIPVSHEPFAIIEEEDDYDQEDEIANDDNTSNNDASNKSDQGLQNAWQYKLSVQKERLGTPVDNARSISYEKTYCHSYDLSRRMRDQHDEDITKNTQIETIRCNFKNNHRSFSKEDHQWGVHLYFRCMAQIKERLRRYPNTTIRLLLLNAPIRSASVAIPLILSYVRSNSLPVVLLLTVRPWINARSNMKHVVSLRRSCEACLTCEGFEAMVNPAPTEFSDLAGILSIRKMALQSLSHFADSITNRRPPANRYGLKRDRRKLHIRMLHLPPEDFSAGGSNGSGQANNHVVGNMKPSCSSNLKPSSSSSLDF